MAFPIGTLLLAAGAMAAVALLLRRMGGGGDEQVSMPDPAPAARDRSGDEPSHAEVVGDGDDDEDDEELGAALDPRAMLFVGSEGEVFLPDRGGVRVLQLGEAQRAVAAGHASWEDLRRQILSRREGAGLPGVGFGEGDFTAGRVVRGAPDADPWRLELLGRDGEYQPFAFEAEDAARGVLALMEERRVIQRPLDDDGAPIPVPADEFAEARRRFEDTLEELANMPDVEPPGDERR